MTDKKRKSSTDVVSRSEFYQLAGLITLAKHHEDALKDLEKAALKITQEIDHEGKPIAAWGGGHTGDAIYGGAHSAEALLELLDITIEEEPDGTQAT